MDRRRFLLTALAGALAAPLAAVAQPARLKVYRVGYLGYDAPGSDPSAISSLRQGLRDLGYVESQNVFIEYRFAGRRPDRLPGLITELMNLKVDVLITQGTVVTAAAQKATTTVPIVSVSGDPVSSGFAQSLARPGGNVTGLSFGQDEGFSGKWLELIREIMPKASRVVFIWNPTNRSGARNLEDLERLAPEFNLQLSSHAVRSAIDIEEAVAAVSRAHISALIVGTDPLVVGQKAQLVELAAAKRIPTVYGLREFVDAGGLMSYGPSLGDLWHRAAAYVDKILKGAKPAHLPIEQSKKFELVINLKTAKALGLTIPPSLLARADQVSE
jgi:putative tryptophan/tyrosine transport system substrate-binding protein